MLGVPTVTIDRTVRLAVAGLNVGKFSDESGDDVKILLTKGNTGTPTLDAFDNLYVNTQQGRAIPLTQVADLKFETSPLSINHFDKIRMVAVTAYVDKGYLVSNVVNDVITNMEAMDLPVGYTYGMGGEVESREESFGGFEKVIIVTIFLFIAVLILEFGTFKST